MSSEQQAGTCNIVGRDFRSFQKEIEILQKQLDSARQANAQLRENSIDRMQEVFQVCQDRLDVQNQKMQEMRDVCRGQNNMLQETCTRVQSLEQELAQQRQQVTELQEEKRQSDQHINSLETVNQNLQEENQKLRDKNSQLEKDIQGFEDQCHLELEKYGRQLQELQVQNGQLRTDNEHLKSQYEAIAQCNNILVGIGSRPEGEEVIRSGVQQTEERTCERGHQAKSTATVIQQEKDDSLNNQGSSNKENTPTSHQNRPKTLENPGSQEKICVPDADMTTQKASNAGSVQKAGENFIMQVDGVDREEDEADEMNLSMDLVQGSKRTQQNSECSSLFTEFETELVDFSTWRYIHKDLDLEFEIKSTPALEGTEQQNLYRFLWIKRGSVVPRFLEHKFEFSETMLEQFREKVLENVMPYLQGQE